MRNVVKVLFFLIITIGAYLIIQIFAGDLAVSVLSSVSVLFTLSIIFIGFVIFLENRNPSQTITWLVLLGSFPLFGFLFYIFFGRNIKKRRLFERKRYWMNSLSRKMNVSTEKQLKNDSYG